MPSAAVISLFALVPALAQMPIKPNAVVKGGAFSPQFAPAHMPNIEVAKKYGVPGGSPHMDSRYVSRTVSTYRAPSPAGGSSSAGAGGLSPEQLAFLERQNAARGGRAAPVPESSRAAPVSYSSRSAYSSYSSGASKSGFAPAFAPPFAPTFMDAPSLELDATQTSPDVISMLAAGLIGAVIGASGVTFVMRFRRSGWSTLKEPLMTVSN